MRQFPSADAVTFSETYITHKSIQNRLFRASQKILQTTQDPQKTPLNSGDRHRSPPWFIADQLPERARTENKAPVSDPTWRRR